MKKLILLASFVLISNSAFASSNLEGDYLCKKGFLGISVADTLSIHSAKSGSLYLYMNDLEYKISKDCKILNSTELTSTCDENKLTVVKKEHEFKDTVTTTLSFEKIRGLVIVKEEINSKHSNELSVLICRTLK